MLKIFKRGETPDAELVRREAGAANVTDTVAAIIADVRQNGDAALLAYTPGLTAPRASRSRSRRRSWTLPAGASTPSL